MSTTVHLGQETNLYECLKVSNNATREEIQVAFKKLVLTAHPDKVANDQKPAAEEMMKQLLDARAILLDPAKRKAYDHTLESENKKTQSIVKWSSSNSHSTSRDQTCQEKHRQYSQEETFHFISLILTACKQSGRSWLKHSLNGTLTQLMFAVIASENKTHIHNFLNQSASPSFAPRPGVR